ncbi:MAG: helix-turn-helix domain-containing protein [Pelagimonas sp.]|jgi:hypothetical protein|nr:helix-turn-helix domain-containing protein [Pelagimonas sp.]
MGRDKKNEKRTDQFAKMPKSYFELEAYKKLSSTAKAALPHLIIRCYAEGKKSYYNNNGRVGLSSRTLARELGCVQRTAMAALADLQAKGWIVCTQKGYPGYEGNAHAPEWRLTMTPTVSNGKHVPPTCEPRKWRKGADYPVIEFSTSKKTGHAPGDASRFKSA